MKAFHTLLILITFISPIWAQTPIPGTKYTLNVPPGFEVATSFSGIQNNANGSSIVISEIPAPLVKMNEGFTAEALKSRGMTLTNDSQVAYDQSQARLLELSQTANGILYLKQILIFGNEQQTILVTGTYPETTKEQAATIRNAILSVEHNQDQNDNPFDPVTFTIDVPASDFKLAKYLMGSLIYTRDGQLPSDKAMFVAGNSISKVNIPDRKEYSLERLKSLPEGESIVVQEISPVELNGLTGFAILADNTNDNSRIYQVMLYNNTNDYYILLGVDKEHKDENLSTFKRIFETFKRK